MYRVTRFRGPMSSRLVEFVFGLKRVLLSPPFTCLTSPTRCCNVDFRFLFAGSFVRCSVPIQFSLEQQDDQNHRRKLRRASFDCVKPSSVNSFIITGNIAIIATNITITVTLITREKRWIVTRLLRSDTRSYRTCLTVAISISPSLDLFRWHYSLARLWLCSVRCYYSIFPRWVRVDGGQLIGDRKGMSIFQSNWIRW
jgi:hypothetical protein